MADFAIWINACEEALWEKDTFMKAYTENINVTVAKVIGDDIVASQVLALFERQMHWTGSSTALLEKLSLQVEESVTRTREWPGNHRALSQKLRRIATPLRHHGVDISFGPAPQRIITIKPVSEAAAATNGSGLDTGKTNNTTADAYERHGRRATKF